LHKCHGGFLDTLMPRLVAALAQIVSRPKVSISSEEMTRCPVIKLRAALTANPARRSPSTVILYHLESGDIHIAIGQILMGYPVSRAEKIDATVVASPPDLILPVRGDIADEPSMTIRVRTQRLLL
jgi:hypothetical protein